MFATVKQATDSYITKNAKSFLWLNPTMLTLLGIIPSILFFLFVLHGQFGFALIALLGNALDGIDGAIARATNKVTAFGGVLDSTLDRIADFLIITVFGFSGLANWYVVLFLLLTSYLVSYIRSRAELASDGKLKLNIGLVERQHRLAAIFVILLLYILTQERLAMFFNIIDAGFIILGFLSAYTFMQRVFFAFKHLK